LCLLTRTAADGERQVLLGHKKTGLGTGKIVALGGHVEEGESADQAAAREVKEEAGLTVDAAALTEVAGITFLFPERPRWDMTVNVFATTEWDGEVTETAEITPQWFPVTALPLAGMWDDARYWLPRILAGERLRATFTYEADCETVASALVEPVP
jgi:8-oxo-dGTP diphosphatase